MHDAARTANLLGAAALGITDLMLAATKDDTQTSVSGAAAVVVLAAGHGLSVTELGRRVGLSQPAAARMVDSLEAAGLVRRSAGSGRAVSVGLTQDGREAFGRLLHARAEPLADLLGGLSTHEQELLDDLLETLLTRLYGRTGNAEVLCRLCDRASCVSSAACPVGQAERDHRG